jgi:hypothetical protein
MIDDKKTNYCKNHDLEFNEIYCPNCENDRTYLQDLDAQRLMRKCVKLQDKLYHFKESAGEIMELIGSEDV